jgi:hypothetical protein
LALAGTGVLIPAKITDAVLTVWTVAGAVVVVPDLGGVADPSVIAPAGTGA